MTPDYREMVYNTQLLYYRVFIYNTFDIKLWIDTQECGTPVLHVIHDRVSLRAYQLHAELFSFTYRAAHTWSKSKMMKISRMTKLILISLECILVMVSRIIIDLV